MIVTKTQLDAVRERYDKAIAELRAMQDAQLEIHEEHQKTLTSLSSALTNIEQATTAVGELTHFLHDTMARWVRESATLRDIEERHRKKLQRDVVKLEAVAEALNERGEDLDVQEARPQLRPTVAIDELDELRIAGFEGVGHTELTDGSEGAE